MKPKTQRQKPKKRKLCGDINMGLICDLKHGHEGRWHEGDAAGRRMTWL